MCHPNVKYNKQRLQRKRTSRLRNRMFIQSKRRYKLEIPIYLIKAFELTFLKHCLLIKVT